MLNSDLPFLEHAEILERERQALERFSSFFVPKEVEEYRAELPEEYFAKMHPEYHGAENIISQTAYILKKAYDGFLAELSTQPEDDRESYLIAFIIFPGGLLSAEKFPYSAALQKIMLKEAEVTKASNDYTLWSNFARHVPSTHIVSNKRHLFDSPIAHTPAGLRQEFNARLLQLLQDIAVVLVCAYTSNRAILPRSFLDFVEPYSTFVEDMFKIEAYTSSLAMR